MVKKNGYGVFICADGEYKGEWKNGDQSGYGVKTWTDGDRYEGNWKDDEINGKGTYTWPDGRKYEGEYQNGKKNGKGTYTWADGRKYEGEYQNGEKNGQGTYLDVNKNTYKGEWKDDEKNGQGIFIYTDNQIYTEKWEDGKLINSKKITNQQGQQENKQANNLYDIDIYNIKKNGIQESLLPKNIKKKKKSCIYILKNNRATRATAKATAKPLPSD